MFSLQEGSLGPPYGLLQGSLASLESTPPREGNVIARWTLAHPILAETVRQDGLLKGGMVYDKVSVGNMLPGKLLNGMCA
jgi:hypothetical protein